ILVADDDPAMLGTLSWILKEQGYDVVSTHEGRRVLELMKQRAPDLVLMDVLFGDSNGTEVLEAIRQDDRWRDIPVVMMSALTPEEAAVRTLGLGAADYVRKPFRVRELLARIQAQLRMRAILRSARDSLRETREALTRVQEQADQRRHLMDIMHDVTDELSTGEIYHLLARRVARALALSQCSVVLSKLGGPPRVAAYAFETGISRDFVLDMDKYPELKTALDTGRAVLVENVMVSPLYRHVREMWARDGTRIATRSVIAIPFAMGADEAGVFFLRRNVTEPPLTPADVEFADTVIRAAVSAIQRATLIETTIADNRRLEELAHTDPLTKTLNRRALSERLASEMERVRRYSTTMSLLLIDLDHFKQVNDTHGHLMGDEVLIEVASLLLRVVRAVDIVARYGGEEFVVVLPETGAPGAEAFAERLRELIEAHCFVESRGAPIRLTTSIGVSAFPGYGVDSVEDLLTSADQALYRAKSEGRNRVRV
ncbi:MAG TPA: diguanylate cyclase, partial [Gemmatimonadaceae bacterium]